jgi:uncharacterized Zn finger protein (UPF0148 family)
MVKCDKCGKVAKDGLILCPNCGHKLSYGQSIASSVQKTSKKVPETEKNKEVKQAIPPIQKKEENNDIPAAKDKNVAVATSDSPYLERKPQGKTSTTLFILLIAVMAAVIILAVMMNTGCTPNWVCGSWQACVDGAQTRACIDNNECGTESGMPEITKACEDTETPVTNQTNQTSQINQTDKCSPINFSCEAAECCEGYCVHGICMTTETFCGDGYCDNGENCGNCKIDCGTCSLERDLVPNVFTEPFTHAEDQQMKNDGYVIVRYFYYDACSPCFYPIHIENELRDIAAQMKDLMVLEIINTFDYRSEAEFKGSIMGRVYTPSIIIEGISQEKSGKYALYATELGNVINSGDLAPKIAEQVCGFSDYCDWDGSKVVRTYNV